MVILSKDQWDAYLNGIPGVHILQTAAWGEFKSRFGWDVVRLRNDFAGVQILFKQLPLGFSWAYIPRGPVGSHWNRLWPLVKKTCRQKRAVFLKVEPDIWENGTASSDLWPSDSMFRPSSHTIQPSRTLVVDISLEEDSILARMKQKTRYNIRLSARKGVQVHRSDNVHRFYELMQVTGNREEFGIHNQNYYQKAFEYFAPQNQCALIFAEFKGELLAAVMVFANGSRCWYFYGSSSNKHRNLMAPYAAQWEAMRWARTVGCSQYDLWGVPDQDQQTLEDTFTKRKDGLWGVYRFKRGFGGELKRVIGTWDWVFNPPLYYFYKMKVKKSTS